MNECDIMMCTTNVRIKYKDMYCLRGYWIYLISRLRVHLYLESTDIRVVNYLFFLMIPIILSASVVDDKVQGLNHWL